MWAERLPGSCLVLVTETCLWSSVVSASPEDWGILQITGRQNWGHTAFCPFLAWRITTKIRDEVASGISAQTLQWPLTELGWGWLGWESGMEFLLKGQGFCLAIIFFFPDVLDIWRFFSCYSPIEEEEMSFSGLIFSRDWRLGRGHVTPHDLCDTGLQPPGLPCVSAEYFLRSPPGQFWRTIITFSHRMYRSPPTAWNSLHTYEIRDRDKSRMGKGALRKAFLSPDSVYFLSSHFRSQFSVLSAPERSLGTATLTLANWAEGVVAVTAGVESVAGRGPVSAVPVVTRTRPQSLPPPPAYSSLLSERANKRPTQWPPAGGEGGGGAHSRGWAGGEVGLHLQCPVRLKPHSCRSTRSSRPEAGWAPRSFTVGWLGQNDPPWWTLL